MQRRKSTLTIRTAWCGATNRAYYLKVTGLDCKSIVRRTKIDYVRWFINKQLKNNNKLYFCLGWHAR